MSKPSSIALDAPEEDLAKGKWGQAVVDINYLIDKKGYSRAEAVKYYMKAAKLKEDRYNTLQNALKG